jgi:hypothetical protein
MAFSFFILTVDYSFTDQCASYTNSAEKEGLPSADAVEENDDKD